MRAGTFVNRMVEKRKVVKRSQLIDSQHNFRDYIREIKRINLRMKELKAALERGREARDELMYKRLREIEVIGGRLDALGSITVPFTRRVVGEFEFEGTLIFVFHPAHERFLLPKFIGGIVLPSGEVWNHKPHYYVQRNGNDVCLGNMLGTVEVQLSAMEYMGAIETTIEVMSKAPDGSQLPYNSVQVYQELVRCGCDGVYSLLDMTGQCHPKMKAVGIFEPSLSYDPGEVRVNCPNCGEPVFQGTLQGFPTSSNPNFRYCPHCYVNRFVCAVCNSINNLDYGHGGACNRLSCQREMERRTRENNLSQDGVAQVQTVGEVGGTGQ